jgi:hypothetical protein
MNVLGISVKQVVVGVEFTPQDLIHLRWFLDKCSIEYNGEDEFEKAAQEYVAENFYPKLVSLLKELENAPG